MGIHSFLISWQKQGVGTQQKRPKELSEIVAHTILNFLLSFFRENKTLYFMWIICLADKHMKYQTLFSQKNKNKTNGKVICCS